MAQVKRETDQKYIEEELAAAQHDTSYSEGETGSTEQYSSPESMRKHNVDHKGSKSQTKGYVS